MAASSVRPPVESTTVPRPAAAITSTACSTLARQAAVENGRTIPVVPRIEMPPTMPRRGLVVLRAIRSPPGTLITTCAPPTARSITSPTAAVICRRGTGLMAGPPTSSPSPGRVTVPTPSPPSSRTPGAVLRPTRAVRCAPWVTSGSSPASLTTAASAQPSPSSQRATGKATRRPVRGRPTSTSPSALPLTSAAAAAFAAAAEQVPVVQPGRRLRAAVLAVRGRSGSRSSGVLAPGALAAAAEDSAGGGGSCRRIGRLPAAEAVAEPGVVEVGAAAVAGQRRSDQHQRLLADVGLPDATGQLGEPAADDRLVRPARAVDHCAGRVRRVASGLQLGLQSARP